MPAPAWLKLLASAPPVQTPPPPPGSGGSINIVNGVWTPARDGAGNVLSTEWGQLPLHTPVLVAGTEFDKPDGSVMERPYYVSPNGYISPQGLFNGWSGAAPSDDEQTIWVNGFGHATSSVCDNAVYRIGLADLVPRRILNRSPMSAQHIWNAATQTIEFGDPQFAETTVLGDGRPGAWHTYHALTYLRGQDFGNVNGAVYLTGNARAFVDLDTNTTTVADWNVVDMSRNFGNATVIRVGSRLWWYSSGRWYEIDTAFVGPSDHAPNSRSRITGKLWWTNPIINGGDDKFVCRIAVKGWAVFFGASSGVHVIRLTEATLANVPNGAVLGQYQNAVTLVSSDGSHTELTAPNNLQHQINGGTGLFTNCAAVYDQSQDCIWVAGNLTGSAVYRIDGISSGWTWTSQRVAANAVLTPSASGDAGRVYGYGTYDRRLFGYMGGHAVLVRLCRVDVPAEIVRLT